MPPGTVLAVALNPAIRDQSYGDEYAWKPMRTPFLDGMFLRYDEPSAVIDRGFNPNYALCAALIRKSAYWFCGAARRLFRVFADWTIGGSAAQIADFSEEVDSGILVPSPLVRQIILIEDGLGGAHRFACTAVDALVGVDVQRAGTS